MDSALLGGALVLCLAAAWHRAHRLGVPRFRGALVTLWLTALIALPMPLYLSAGVGLWLGAMLVEPLGLPAYIGAALGIVVTPACVCALALGALSHLLTAPRGR